MNKKLIIIVLIVILVVVGVYFGTKKQAIAPSEAPTVVSTTGEEEKSMDVTPKVTTPLGTTYITTENWPPKIQASILPFACITGGKEISSTGKKEEKTINNQIYCVNTMSEGAAGSTYTTYHYITAQEDHTVESTFTLRFAQCVNYDDQKKAECEKERKTFDIDNIIDGIFNSVTL